LSLGKSLRDRKSMLRLQVRRAVRAEVRPKQTPSETCPMDRLQPISIRPSLVGRLAAGALVLLCTATAAALEVDGFTEPFRSVDVACGETGIVAEMAVEEGDAVAKGDVIAVLDRDLHAILVRMAAQSKEATGRLNAAVAELEMRQARLVKLEELRARGFGRQEEVERGTADVAIAEANVQTAREDRMIKQIDFEKFNTQYERRTVRAPLSGVVSRKLKEEGEFVAPNDPYVVTVVQLDPLLATFSVESGRAAGLHTGDSVSVRLAGVKETVEGLVHHVAPTTDAESGTVRVKVRIENAAGEYRSGERCLLSLPGGRKEKGRSVARAGR